MESMADRKMANEFMFLVAKRITSVRYMTQEEADALMWSKRPLIITLNDGSMIVPQMDDEGNNGGALWVVQNGEQDKLVYTI
jgi:hypothetical protein